MSLMNEELKKIFLAGVGAVAVTAEKSKEMLDSLVEKGELTVEQGKVLNEELKHNIKETLKNNKNEKESMNKDNILENIEKLSPDELEVVKAKIAEMEKISNGENKE